MRHEFAKVLADLVRTRSRAEIEAAAAGSGGRVVSTLEHELRERSRVGDRIASVLGFVLAVGATSFLVYAVETSGEFRKSGLAMPRIAVNATEDSMPVAGSRRSRISDPETTGALARETVRTDGALRGSAAKENEREDFGLYTVKRAFQGFATLEGPVGTVDVIPGSEVPGAGKVTAIKQVAGRWVVETSAGVIQSVNR